MKIGRFSDGNGVRIGKFEDDNVIDFTDQVGSFSHVLGKMVDGNSVATEGGEQIPTETIDYLPPTTAENTVFAAALNYHSHIEEGFETTAPDWPLMFMKLYRSLIGHREAIRYDPSVTDELDYEAELAAVIGRPARNVSVKEALDYVAGYTILNDVSARNIQRVNIGDVERLDWFSGKALQGSSPLGPYIVSADEVGSPDELHIESRLNGELMQDEGTSLMIRDVADLVSFVSTRVELVPGDVIATGTPEGVGLFQDIQLGEGDEIEITIDGIGTLTNSVKESPSK